MEVCTVLFIFVTILPLALIGNKVASDKRERILYEASVGLKGVEIEKGGIFSKESFIHLSNLKLINDKNKKKTEVKK